MWRLKTFCPKPLDCMIRTGLDNDIPVMQDDNKEGNNLVLIIHCHGQVWGQRSAPTTVQHPWSWQGFILWDHVVFFWLTSCITDSFLISGEELSFIKCNEYFFLDDSWWMNEWILSVQWSTQNLFIRSTACGIIQRTFAYSVELCGIW